MLWLQILMVWFGLRLIFRDWGYLFFYDNIGLFDILTEQFVFSCLPFDNNIVSFAHLLIYYYQIPYLSLINKHTSTIVLSQIAKVACFWGRSARIPQFISKYFRFYRCLFLFLKFKEASINKTVDWAVLLINMSRRVRKLKVLRRAETRYYKKQRKSVDAHSYGISWFKGKWIKHQ